MRETQSALEHAVVADWSSPAIPLNLSREQLAIVLAGIADGSTALNPDGKLVYSNDIAARSGTSHHFCVRAIVTAPGDPNTDNKRVLSNFGSVRVRFRKFVDILLMRCNIGPIPERIELVVVPRLIPGMEVAQRDLTTQRIRVLGPGEVSQDELRLSYWPVKGGITQTEIESDPCRCETTLPQLHTRPDPLGHYPADPRTLPPGVAGKPMLTIVHMAGGVPQGGVTLMITPDDSAKPRRRRKR